MRSEPRAFYAVWMALYLGVIVMSPAIEPRRRSPIEPALRALAGASILVTRE